MHASTTSIRLSTIYTARYCKDPGIDIGRITNGVVGFGEVAIVGQVDELRALAAVALATADALEQATGDPDVTDGWHDVPSPVDAGLRADLTGALS